LTLAAIPSNNVGVRSLNGVRERKARHTSRSKRDREALTQKLYDEMRGMLEK
jgi:hypothetical protein